MSIKAASTTELQICMRIYTTQKGKLVPVCSFRFMREAIACMPAIARVLKVRVWAKAPSNVMVADLPRGCHLETQRVESYEVESLGEHTGVTCIVANP